MKLLLGIGETKTLSQEGRYFYLVDSAGLVDVELRESDGGVSERVPLQAGQGIISSELGAGRFERVQITNRHAEAQEIEFFISSNQFIDNRSVVTGAVAIKPRATFAGVPKMTATGTIAANGLRAQLELSVDQASTGTVWLGGVEDEGIPLKAGSSYQIAFTGAMPVLFVGTATLYVAEIF